MCVWGPVKTLASGARVLKDPRTHVKPSSFAATSIKLVADAPCSSFRYVARSDQEILHVDCGYNIRVIERGPGVELSVPQCLTTDRDYLRAIRGLMCL
jgi:hypothetical protein